MKDKNVRIYDVFIGDEEGPHVAVTKSGAKAEALVKALEDCGTEAYMLSRTVSSELEWVKELTE